MGDFNTDMSKSLLPQFISRTGLQTWKADDQSIGDYSLFCGIMSSPPKWKRMLFL
jgi:hypothetical protein